MDFKSLYPQGYDRRQVYHYLQLGEDILYGVKTAPGSANETPVYRNKLLNKKLYDKIHPELDTHAKLFDNAVELYGDRPCFSTRRFDYNSGTSEDKFESISYNQVNERRLNFGSGILHSLINNPYVDTIEPEVRKKILEHVSSYQNYWTTATPRTNIDYEIEKKTSFILSIFAANRQEWVLTDLACSSYAITNTALYDNLGHNVTQYILETTKSPIVVCSADKIEHLLEFKRTNRALSNIIQIVSMDPASVIRKEYFEKAKDLGIVLMDIQQVEQVGEENRLERLHAHPQSLFTISFTSGTTGSKPKGVMLTNETSVAAISGLQLNEPYFDKSNGQRAFIFLPLTHIYERQTSAFAWSRGYNLGFPQLTNSKSVSREPFVKLIEDLRLFKPHYFLIVPRLLTKLESHIKTAIDRSPHAAHINEIISSKVAKQLKADGETGADPTNDSFAPYVALRKLVGFDHLIWTQTASAPVAPSTLVYLKGALGIGVRQLYGMTETYGGMTTSPIYEAMPGSCGSVFPTQEAKLSKSIGGESDNRGELLVRGANNCKGYYFNREETQKLFSDDLWLSTGDIATIDEKTGRLHIVDRVKNFFKLSHGEYVSPEKVENRYLSSNTCINQLYVHGDSVRSFLVGIVGIDYESGMEFLKSQGISNKLSTQEMLEMINQVQYKKAFLQLLNKTVEKSLLGIERLHNIHIEVNPLTVERDVVTPTFKIKRGIASKFFKNVFDRLYDVEQSLLHPRAHL